MFRLDFSFLRVYVYHSRVPEDRKYAVRWLLYFQYGEGLSSFLLCCTLLDICFYHGDGTVNGWDRNEGDCTLLIYTRSSLLLLYLLSELYTSTLC